MNYTNKYFWIICVAGLFLLGTFVDTSAADRNGAPDLWKLAQNMKQVHRFSTLFTAHNVREYLATDDGIDKAIDWCRKTGVTKVYIEEFRDGYQADRAVIQHAKEKFLAAGFDVSGCVTTTRIGKSSTHWKGTIS